LESATAKGNSSTTSKSPATNKEDEALLLPVDVMGESSTTSRSSRTLSYGGTKDSSSSESIGNNNDNDNDNNTISSPELERLLEQESKVPWTRIAEVSGLFVVVVGLNLLSGSGGSLEWLLPFEIKCGSPAFYWLERSIWVLIVVFALYIRRELIRDTANKQALQYEFAPGDIVWNGTNTLQYSSIFSVAGLVAGLFGIGKQNHAFSIVVFTVEIKMIDSFCLFVRFSLSIGGGVVKSPLMLEMGKYIYY
jgi:hypothetical protein